MCIVLFRMMLPLPGYDEQFRKVVISRTPQACNASSVKILDLEKANLMIGNVSSLHHEQYCCHRIVMIYDFKGFSFSSLDAEFIWVMRTMMRFYQVTFITLLSYNKDMQFRRELIDFVFGLICRRLIRYSPS